MNLSATKKSMRTITTLVIFTAIFVTLSIGAFASTVVGSFTDQYFKNCRNGAGDVLQQPVVSFPDSISKTSVSGVCSRSIKLGEKITIIVNKPTFKWCANQATTVLTTVVTSTENSFEESSRESFGSSEKITMCYSKKSKSKYSKIRVTWTYSGPMYWEKNGDVHGEESIVTEDIATADGYFELDEGITVGSPSHIGAIVSNDGVGVAYKQVIPVEFSGNMEAAKCNVTVKCPTQSQTELVKYFTVEPTLKSTVGASGKQEFFLQYNLLKATPGALQLVLEFKYENNVLKFFETTDYSKGGENNKIKNCMMRLSSGNDTN